ncbi:alpha/beta fold hydrolase [Rhizobium puerariae]|uniref:Alpha/beta fold hydrolase n=1 Tax=Rhizobium puerariae TaxID=1585791 RepID=A0ABV6AKZ4_9HYPH
MSSISDQPDVTQRLTVELSDGATVSVRRWGPERERRIVLSHGNGLAADGLWVFGRELLTDFEVVAFDLRNHGQSAPADQPEMPWPRYIADIPEIFDAIIDGFGARETHGAFHSMSSACTLIAQTQNPRPWASLTLFEPPIAPASSPDLVAKFDVMQQGLAERTMARRREFPGPEDLARSFGRAPTFNGIPPDAILQLARATLRPADAGWQLACAAEIEASNFVTAVDLARHWADFSRVDVPVQLILGDEAVHDMPLLARFGRSMEQSFGFSVITCPGTNHFMQLQQPAFCARQVAAFAKRNSKAPPGADATNNNKGTNNETTRGSAIGV